MSLIVDADVHVDVGLDELAPFLEPPLRREIQEAMPGSLLPGTLGAPASVAVPRSDAGSADHAGAVSEPDYTIVFPTLLLTMTYHPSVRMETAMARGYARWLTDVYLPGHPRARALLYLPVRDLHASCRLVDHFGEAVGIVGAFVAGPGVPQSLESRDMRLYRILEERNLPLALHPVFLWTEPPFRVFDNYLAAYAYAHPFTQAAHLMNWIISGMPERFPGLACVFYGAGVAWLGFVAHRLDQGYMRRPSEAPLLRERPSHYMRRYFYGTHPLEAADVAGHLEATFRLVGPSQFVYASNFPQWDFDRPQVIRALGFLTSEERDGILGTNAARLFGLAEAT